MRPTLNIIHSPGLTTTIFPPNCVDFLNKNIFIPKKMKNTHTQITPTHNCLAGNFFHKFVIVVVSFGFGNLLENNNEEM